MRQKGPSRHGAERGMKTPKDTKIIGGEKKCGQTLSLNVPKEAEKLSREIKTLRQGQRLLENAENSILWEGIFGTLGGIRKKRKH